VPARVVAGLIDDDLMLGMEQMGGDQSRDPAPTIAIRIRLRA